MGRSIRLIVLLRARAEMPLLAGGPMMRAPMNLPLILAALTAIGLASGTAKGQDATGPDAANSSTDKAFQKAKREYQQKARNRKPAERLAALKLLEDFPTAESAELIYLTLIDDHADDVWQAAVSLLVSWRDRDEVSDRLFRRMKTTTRESGMDQRALGALRILAASEDAALQERVVAFLNEYLGTAQIDLYVLHAMIDAGPAPGGSEEFSRMLVLFSRAAYFDSHFGFRRCTVQGLMQSRTKDELKHLIDLLPGLKGLVLIDVVSHLNRVTGQNFGDDAAKWKSWLAQRGDQPKSLEKLKTASSSRIREYYGIPITAKRVVFVLDTSGSMVGAKIAAAQTELIRVVQELPADVDFSIIGFAHTVRVWQPLLVPATSEFKEAAVSAVLEQQARGGTASFDALEAAFGLDPEAIYFVSDGAPSGGKTDVPKEIIGTISKWNRVRRISIHTIGIGIDSKNEKTTNPFSRFMRGLAEANWGLFKSLN
jgi:hypothetical protein